MRCNGGSEPAETKDNGVAALAPNEALDRARTALKDAGSYQVKGSIVNDGDPIALDFRVRGDDLAGQVTYEGATVQLLAVGGQQFIRPDEKFWEVSSGAGTGTEMAKLLGDRWVKVPADDKDLDDMFGIANVDKMFEIDGTLTKGGTKDIAGVPTVGLVDGGAKGGTVYVATEGDPYPMRMEGTDANPGELTFSDFGAPFDDLKAPAEAEVVDFEQLTKKN
ncbi:hypothetical protein [Micromonospora sp. NPDC049799]|uniref:hypothetical protein n=1 Tax=Micromonospora sp. NPDC049799 TaxID=3154741 RepID=UPI0033FFEC5A